MMDYYHFSKEKLVVNSLALVVCIVFIAINVYEYVSLGELTDHSFFYIVLWFIPAIAYRIYSYYKLQAIKKQEHSLEAVTRAEHRQGHLITIVSYACGTLMVLTLLLVDFCFKEEPFVWGIVVLSIIALIALVATLLEILTLKKIDKEFESKQ